MKLEKKAPDVSNRKTKNMQCGDRNKCARQLATDLLNLREDLSNDEDYEAMRLLTKLFLLRSAKPGEQTTNEQNLRKCLKGRNPVVRVVAKCLGIDLFGIWTVLCVLTVFLFTYSLYYQYLDLALFSKDGDTCLIRNFQVFQEIARHPVSCSVCQDLKEIPIYHNMTTAEFQQIAYKNVPLVIKNAMQNWTAVQIFSLPFFRRLYSNFSDAFLVQNEQAQFFGYQTEFTTLKEALFMSKMRQKKPWYFGWSNYHKEVSNILRQHYKRPYFLPSDSESSDIDWIFMGTSGKAAHLHLDYVDRPSWQAQISGHKQWSLVPSAECMNICKSFNVTVTPGDIIIVDTNQWYHSTYVHPGNISITIGSEYD